MKKHEISPWTIYDTPPPKIPQHPQLSTPNPTPTPKKPQQPQKSLSLQSNKLVLDPVSHQPISSQPQLPTQKKMPKKSKNVSNKMSQVLEQRRSVEGQSFWEHRSQIYEQQNTLTILRIIRMQLQQEKYPVGLIKVQLPKLKEHILGKDYEFYLQEYNHEKNKKDTDTDKDKEKESEMQKQKEREKEKEKDKMRERELKNKMNLDKSSMRLLYLYEQARALDQFSKIFMSAALRHNSSSSSSKKNSSQIFRPQFPRIPKNKSAVLKDNKKAMKYLGDFSTIQIEKLSPKKHSSMFLGYDIFS